MPHPPPPVLLALSGTDWAFIAGALIAGLIAGALAIRFASGVSLARARDEARRLVETAELDAKADARKIELEAQEKLLAAREKADAEAKARRDELNRTERDLNKREAKAERELEQAAEQRKALDRDKQSLADRTANVEEREAEVAAELDKQRAELVRISKMSEDEAKAILLERVEDSARQDAAKIIRVRLEEAETQAREKATELTLQAMQRYAGEHVSESTVRTVEIPSDDVKGRIIGREGRNIRAIEKAAGVDLIVDDTPGVILVSCFDKVRQAVAVEALTRLIADGRIHPTRVEEVINKVRSEMDEDIMKRGKEAQQEVKLRKLHPKVVAAMGRLHYRTSFGQNVLAHSIEVAFISQMIADQLGLNGNTARRCGFLHDIGKSMDHEMEGGHPAIGMDFAAQYGETDPVLNVIGGHHGDIPSTSYYTPIVMTADALSGARPGARRESLDLYIKRLEQLQDIALSNEGVEEAFAIQAGREVRVMVNASKVSDDEAYVVAKKIAERVSDEMTFPGEIRVTVLRETRAIEIAR